jgi:hypothetical protein
MEQIDLNLIEKPVQKYRAKDTMDTSFILNI